MDITVIVDKGVTTDVGTLSSEEREILFDDIAKANPAIPRAVIDGLAELVPAIVTDEARLDKPELAELLTRKIVSLAHNEVHGGTWMKWTTPMYNTLVIPIVQIPDAVTRVGGAILPMRRTRAPPTVATVVPDAIKVRFDNVVFVATTDGVGYVAPIGEDVNIVGLVINPACAPLMTADRSGLIPLGETNDTPRVADMLASGMWDYRDMFGCNDYFPKCVPAVDVGGESHREAFRVDFADLDPGRVLKVLEIVFDYLANLERYRRSEMSAQLIHTVAKLAGRAVTYNPTLVTMPTPSAPRPRILDAVEAIHSGKFSTVFAAAVPADMELRGFSRIYQYALLHGADSKEVVAGIAEHKAARARRAFQFAAGVRDTAIRNQINTYRAIIERKLGSTRLAEVNSQLLARPALIATGKGILELLKPPERKSVEIEFDRRAKYLEAVVNNKCPHVALYRRFRLSNDDERTSAAYAALKRFFKVGGEMSMITCNNCGFDIICPHMREFSEMELAGKKHSEIKSRLTKYIDRSVVKDQYYCKICGEMISSLEAFGDADTRDPSSTMDEELKMFMWGEIAGLTRNLRFGNLVNVPQLITTARDVCYPFVFEIEKQILKSKTTSAGGIKAKKRLYTTIYAFAYFIHLIMSNKGRAGENDIGFRNFTAKSGKSQIVDMIKHAIEVITVSRNIIIREIPGMSPDIVRNTLIESYKSIQATGTQVIVYSNEAEDLLATLMVDPVYHYYFAINTVDAALHGKRVPGAKKQFALVDDVDHIMGSTVAKIEKGDKSKDVYEHALVPRFDKWHTQAFDNLQPFAGSRIGTPSRSPATEAGPGFAARSFELFASKQRQRVYKEQLFVDVSASTGRDVSAPLDVKFRPVHEEQRARYLELQTHADELRKYRFISAVQNYHARTATHTRRWADPHVTLSRLYDEDGRPHVWGIFITEQTTDGKVQRKEYTNRDIASTVEKGTKFGQVITERKCSVCGILRANVNELSEDKIYESLRARRSVANFFRFYENRCPKSGLHDFGADGVCTRCTMSSAFLLSTGVGGTDALSFYREYKGVYERERLEFASSAPVRVEPLAMPTDTGTYTDEYAGWSANFNAVLDLAHKLKINHRLLSALGGIERQEYTDVQSGAFIPPDVEDKHATRIFTVSSIVKNLITEYNQLRFFHKLVKPPPALSALVDESGINKHKMTELFASLPDIFDDYNNRFDHVRKHKKPREVVSFCIQRFCEMCLIIWNDSNKDTEQIRHAFVTHIVKTTLRGDELSTKAGYFNWSLLYGDKETKDTDANYDKDTGDRGGIDDEVEDAQDDPLGTDGFDVEDEGDEDGGNGVRAGENLGLD